MRICDDHALAALEAQRTQSTHSCPAVFAVGWGKGEVMEHDELCPARCDFGDYANGKPNTMCRGGDCTRCDEVDCLCDGPVSLIARVRADEREACARRVEAWLASKPWLDSDDPDLYAIDTFEWAHCAGWMFEPLVDLIRQNTPAPGQEGTVGATEPPVSPNGPTTDPNGSQTTTGDTDD